MEQTSTLAYKRGPQAGWTACLIYVEQAPKLLSGGGNMQNFYNKFAGHFGSVSRSGLAAIGIASALASVSDVIFIAHDKKLMFIDFAMFAFVIPGHLSASYIAAMAMLDAPINLASYLRFLRGNLYLWGGLMAGIALLLIAPQGANRDAFLTNGLILASIGLLALMFLPALPIADALGERVRPWDFLKATKGHRFALVGLFMASGSLDRLVPDLKEVDGLLAIIGVLACDFFINAATNLFYAALAVTSWQFAKERLHDSIARD